MSACTSWGPSHCTSASAHNRRACKRELRRERKSWHPLLAGMDLLGDCEFIAIFDADFKPEPDFLASGCLTTVASKRPAFIKAVG